MRRADLVAAGITAGEIKARLASGALLREHRGVYRVGHRAPSVEARYLAAVWAGGEGALLCGLAAAYLLGLVAGPFVPRAEVLARVQRRIEGVRVRRGLNPRDSFLWRGVPVTSPARTMVDLASALSVDDVARAFHEAGIRHHLTPDHVEAVLRRRPNSPGAAKLRAVIHGEVPLTLSALERRFRRLLRANGLALPRSNRRIEGRLIDSAGPSIA